MNKNSTPIILLILAIGIYFTFTKGKIEEYKAIKNVNAGYQQAIENSEKLMKIRDDVQKAYNEIEEVDKNRLEKMVPNNIDNVRLTLDVKNIGLSRGLVLNNVKTTAPNINTGINTKNTATANNSISPNPVNGNMDTPIQSGVNSEYNIVTLSFDVSTTYPVFLELLRDLETSLRIMDVSKISFATSETGVYDFSVELKTYWLKQ